jgi:hypothetical protein
MTHHDALVTLAREGMVYYRSHIVWVAPYEGGLTCFALARGDITPIESLLYNDDPLLLLYALDQEIDGPHL